MNTTAAQHTELDLDEEKIARDAAEFSRRLEAADVHRDDQAQADEQHRGELQERFNEIGLPRGLAPIL